MNPGDDTDGLGVSDVGVYSARRYRLTSSRSSVTALAPATIRLYWADSVFHVEISHYPWHAATAQWVANTPIGETMLIQGWTPMRPPTGDCEQVPLGWNVIDVDAVMHSISTGVFIGTQRHHQHPRYTVATSPPPIEESASTVSIHNR